MKLERFKAEHLQGLELQEAQAYFSDQLRSAEYAKSLELSGGFTGLVDGKVIACGGCAEVWQGRAVVWALISKDAGRYMVQIHRAVRGFLMASQYRRIEAWVDVGFAPGERWLEMLGFTKETPEPMQGFRPDGGACFLFSRVK